MSSRKSRKINRRKFWDHVNHELGLANHRLTQTYIGRSNGMPCLVHAAPKRYLAYRAKQGGIIVSQVIEAPIRLNQMIYGIDTWYFRRAGSTPEKVVCGSWSVIGAHSFPDKYLHPDRIEVQVTPEQIEKMEGGRWQPLVKRGPYPEILKHSENLTYCEVVDYLGTCFRFELRDHTFEDREVYFEDQFGRTVATGYSGSAGYELGIGKTVFHEVRARELLKLGTLKDIERNDRMGSDDYRGY